MSTTFTYPGVYIQEFAPGSPIAGVGTSTAAFLGPAASGLVNTPTKLTSMDQFTTMFGDQPMPGFYLWHAVKGFFDNGGQVCYIVRVSNGKYGFLDLLDSVTPAGNKLIHVQARRLGTLTPNIQIGVAASSLVSSATVYAPTADTFTVTGSREITLGTAHLAAQFRPGDSVQVGAFGDHVVTRISGVVFRLAEDLTAPVGTTGSVRLSDSLVGARVFRISAAGALLPAGALVPGTMLTITQGTSDSQIVDSVQTEYLQTTPSPTVTYRVTLRNGLNLAVTQGAATTVVSNEFDLSVHQGVASTIYDHLAMDPAHPRYFANVINGDSTGQILVNAIEPPPNSIPPHNLPAGLGLTFLGGSAPETLTNLAASDYMAAIDSLQSLDDVNLVAVPDAITLGAAAAVQQYIIQHCEQMGNRFAVLDGAGGLPQLFGAGSIETQRQGLDSSRGYAALYYPWIRIQPPGPGAPMLVPPSGHVCGIMARSDSTRGVHKAPANEIVNGALGLEKTMSDVDQGQLNIEGINIIRQFHGGRPMVWGARTTSPDTNWRYVNIRRLFLFLEQSIQEGIRWAVFEPNNTALWAKLKRTITEFLTRVWRDGALFGDTADAAFYVKIDESLNTDTTRALGQLFIEIGVRPSYPAEFIIVRIGIWQGGSDVSEQ
jgi:phage tail sheath protein FI